MAKKTPISSKKTASKKTASKKTASKKPVSKNLPTKADPKKLSLSINAECLWQVNYKDLPTGDPFFDNFNKIKAILDSYIKIITKDRPKLKDLTIKIDVFKEHGLLVVDITFIQYTLFTLKIGKLDTGNIYFDSKYNRFSHGGGREMPPPDWYASFLSVCNCIYNDIYSMLNK
jgi:hypothetical protein